MESLPPDPPKRKLLDQVRDAIRLKHYSYRTEQRLRCAAVANTLLAVPLLQAWALQSGKTDLQKKRNPHRSHQ
ncbi:hypothetical protein E1H12_20315 [Geitlerinema sp. P-1104]|nr:hypothetical protein [Geitlerinema sp. P-1104]